MDKSTQLNSIVLGAATSVTIGNFLFEALGALVLGIIGAIGGYIFNRFVKPKIDGYFSKKLNKHVEK